MVRNSTFFYLHGFASSPQSTKARDLCDRFTALNLTLHTPDLNQSDFTHLTLTRQLNQVKAELPTRGAITLIGSSFGGLTAAWLGQQVQQVDRLVLLAPAFRFFSYWSSQLGQAQMQQWQTEQSLMVYHYSEDRQLPLDYQFVTDLLAYKDDYLQRPVSTLILHGSQDDVIPIQASREYAATRPWVDLIELESDHSLLNVGDAIWQAIQTFCQLAIVKP